MIMTKIRQSPCRAQSGCNVFVFCPSFEGCAVGEVPFPPFGCQLKYLANLSSDPTAFPAASERGPPTSFDSGERLGIRPSLGFSLPCRDQPFRADYVY